MKKGILIALLSLIYFSTTFSMDRAEDIDDHIITPGVQEQSFGESFNYASMGTHALSTLALIMGSVKTRDACYGLDDFTCPVNGEEACYTYDKILLPAMVLSTIASLISVTKVIAGTKQIGYQSINKVKRPIIPARELLGLTNALANLITLNAMIHARDSCEINPCDRWACDTQSNPAFWGSCLILGLLSNYFNWIDWWYHS